MEQVEDESSIPIEVTVATNKNDTSIPSEVTVGTEGGIPLVVTVPGTQQIVAPSIPSEVTVGILLPPKGVEGHQSSTPSGVTVDTHDGTPSGVTVPNTQQAVAPSIPSGVPVGILLPQRELKDPNPAHPQGSLLTMQPPNAEAMPKFPSRRMAASSKTTDYPPLLISGTRA